MTGHLRFVGYRPELQPHFEGLNRAWLEEYFTVEPIDSWVLGSPEEAILQGGGSILFAEIEGTIVGTVALKPAGPGVLELTKMAVDKAYQGQGIGRQLCRRAVEEARTLGARSVILYSHSRLAAALQIYRGLGFVDVPLEPGKYVRADVMMRLQL